jgi:hypothetical protein
MATERPRPRPRHAGVKTVSFEDVDMHRIGPRQVYDVFSTNVENDKGEHTLHVMYFNAD